MASIALSAAALASGTTQLMNSHTVLGNLAMALGGGLFDQQTNSKFTSSGSRLKDLSVQSSSYGAMLPIIFGTVRIAGNIIWAMPIKENASTTVMSTRGKGRSMSRTHTHFSYSVSLAISLGEGEIDEVLRIWADTKLLDLSRYSIRVYKGSEMQMPDPLLEGVQGKGQTPAYRGQAYVVFEDFPLSEFANRLPNFTFEVKRLSKSQKEERLEDLIESIVIIPGGGEFVYDTVSQSKIEGDKIGGKWCQRGKVQSINQHNNSNKANALLSLDQLQSTLPNVKWTAPVVTWFATSLRLSDCEILPGVEYQSEATTSPDTWQVGNFQRQSAYQIRRANGRPVYGGTVNDLSIIRYLKELKSRGYKIMFYPMFFMDLPKKPWRGRLSGLPEEVHQFFHKPNGYNRFILHYAQLVKGLVDAFVIGSELVGLTKISDEHYNFPAVDELVTLAQLVKNILGGEVKITYAADWSEYHHSKGGWYNLDPLWASPAIDFIGIDAYFPLTEASHSLYEVNEVMKGWTEGEGYDFYYEDSLNKSGKNFLAPEYAWKNIEWWWANEHINPNGNKTAWQPKSKKIWFTEYGFPSVDCCSNTPNVFHDLTSQESRFPYLSCGKPDFRAQRTALTATEKKWQNSDMVERKFIWTWDARPYPFWPEFQHIWSDGSAWLYGHWIQGKLGLSSLAAIVEELILRTGLSFAQVDSSRLKGDFNGMALEQQTTLRNVLEMLQQSYFFDTIEKDGKLQLFPRENKETFMVDPNDLLERIVITRAQEIELPGKIDVNFINTARNYRIGNQHAERFHAQLNHGFALNFPICLDESRAQNIAQISLYNRWMERTRYSLVLPSKYLFLTPGCLLKVNNYLLRITSINYGSNFALQVEGVAEDLEIYTFQQGSFLPGSSQLLEPLGQSRLEILDLPTLSHDFSYHQGHIYFAVVGLHNNWSKASIFASMQENSNYEEIIQVNKQAIIGNALNNIDALNADEIIVNICGGEIANVKSLAVLGDEVIEFSQAQLVAAHQYKISRITRAKYGERKSHHEGERFVLINSDLYKYEIAHEEIGRTFYLKVVSGGGTLAQAVAQKFIYQANNLKPYSPINVQYQFNSEGDLLFVWQRRSRLQSHSSNLPLGEEKEEYYYELIKGNDILFSGRSVSAMVSIPIKKMSAEKMLFKVAQVSALVGIGEFSQLEVEGIGQM
jgi:hypothetical protein